MKQGIVMGCYDRFMIVLTKEGEFVKAKQISDCTIGEEVNFELFTQDKRIHLTKKITSHVLTVASIMLLIIVPLSLFYHQPKSYAFINIDANPSIEIELKRDLTVKNIKPLNVDAIHTIRHFEQTKGMAFEEFLSHLMMICEKSDYLDDKRQMLIGINYGIEETEHEQIDISDLKTDHDNWEIAAYNVPSEVREIAKQSHLSMNRVLANKMEEQDESILRMFEETNQDSIQKKDMITTFYDE